MNHKQKKNMKQRRMLGKSRFGKIGIYNTGRISRIWHSHTINQKNRRKGTKHIEDMC